jgi:hypothetical protein
LADAFRIGGVKAHFCRRSMKAMISEFVTCYGKSPVKAHTERLAAGMLGSAPPKNGSLVAFIPLFASKPSRLASSLRRLDASFCHRADIL